MDNTPLNLGAGSGGSSSQPATQNPQNIGVANLLPAGTSSLQGGANNPGLNNSGPSSIPLSNFQLSQEADSTPNNSNTHRGPLIGASIFVIIVIIVVVVFIGRETTNINKSR